MRAWGRVCASLFVASTIGGVYYALTYSWVAPLDLLLVDRVSLWELVPSHNLLIEGWTRVRSAIPFAFDAAVWIIVPLVIVPLLYMRRGRAHERDVALILDQPSLSAASATTAQRTELSAALGSCRR